MEHMTMKRDERGRLIAEDGLPAGGLATVADCVAVSKLCRSKIYDMIQSGELPAKRFGRCVRVSWEDVRRVFL